MLIFVLFATIYLINKLQNAYLITTQATMLDSENIDFRFLSFRQGTNALNYSWQIKNEAKFSEEQRRQQTSNYFDD